MFIRLSFVTLIFAVAALGMPVKRDAAKVGQDIEDLDKQVQALDASVNAFPNMGGTLAQVYAIHQATESVDKVIMTTTNDANASEGFNDDEGNSIFSLIKERLGPDVKKGLDDLVAKHPAISALHASPIAEADINILKKDSNALGNAIVAKAPANLKSDIMEQFDAINKELANAANVYST
ncbi:hydrophobic surface binding protein A-domain-containing protein [Boletus reticuloceps]|uniref:Hydrophobic surface binding protein A-domain-containing protein n=1 Tax=Boletus reticuloceps TaxID=495285 RepID=A0A8I3AC91_9AGAM|nr:hydrophobic surface binding protein A-domain-containing protein [Boletus reticuloceps]